MRRFDLLDEFTAVYMPFRRCDGSHQRDDPRRPDVRMDVDRHWLLVLALLMLGKRPG